MRAAIVTRANNARVLVVEDPDGSVTFGSEATDMAGRRYWQPVELNSRDRVVQLVELFSELALGDATAAPVGP